MGQTQPHHTRPSTTVATTTISATDRCQSHWRPAIMAPKAVSGSNRKNASAGRRGAKRCSVPKASTRKKSNDAT